MNFMRTLMPARASGEASGVIESTLTRKREHHKKVSFKNKRDFFPRLPPPSASLGITRNRGGNCLGSIAYFLMEKHPFCDALLNESIKKADKQLVEMGKALPGYENIVSIKGIGERSAAVLLSTIGNIDEFEDEGKLAAYLGMVPKVSNSNDTTHHGRITKRGSKLGRTTLVQCTLAAIRYSDYLRKFYEKIKSRRGSGKAVIATAKKMVGIIFKTLKNGWVFEDFPNFVLVKSLE